MCCCFEFRSPADALADARRRFASPPIHPELQGGLACPLPA
jgi:hypothetical protein